MRSPSIVGRWVRLGAMALALIPVSGCDDDQTQPDARCVPGESVACAAVGCDGAQVCAPDGRAFGPCICPGGEVMDSADALTSNEGPVDPAADASAERSADAGAVVDMAANSMDSGRSEDESPDAGSEEGAPTCRGYATRYWDCCKSHCGWSANVPDGVSAVTSCSLDNQPQAGNHNSTSGCDVAAPDSAYTCFSMAPWSVNDGLAYGYAAVPATGDICGRCYELTFDGTGHYSADDPGSQLIQGKRMIVQATNIGFDVAGRQFDLLVPGGGVGLFDACTQQWGLPDNSALGAQYGGLLTACQRDPNHPDHASRKQCVRDRCEALFGAPEFADLRAGCAWFVDWFHAADNPNLAYREVPCPDELTDVSGVDRRPLNDVEQCEQPSTEDQGQCECDCAWTDGGARCGQDDGSCCWTVCCGDID